MLAAVSTPRELVPARNLASLRPRARRHLAGSRAPRSVSASHGVANWTSVSIDKNPSPVFELAATVVAPAPPQPNPHAHQMSVKVLFGGFLTVMLAGFAACIAGFFIAVKELVRTCREATIASKNVADSCENFSKACDALKVTMAQADSVLYNTEVVTSGGQVRRRTAAKRLQPKLADSPIAAKLFQGQGRIRGGMNANKEGPASRGDTISREAMYTRVMQLIDQNGATAQRVGRLAR